MDLNFTGPVVWKIFLPSVNVTHFDFTTLTGLSMNISGESGSLKHTGKTITVSLHKQLITHLLIN
jgi:hypothetical protein